MQFDILTNSAVVIGLTLLAMVFIFQTQQKHRRVFFLSLGLIFPIVGQLIYIFISVTSNDALYGLIGKHIRDFLFGFFYYLVFLHFHSLIKERSNNILVNINFGILSIFGSLVFFSIVTTNSAILDITGRFANLIGLSCFAYISYVSFIVARTLKERESIVEFFSLFIIFLAHIIYVLGDNFVLGTFDYNTLADTMGIIGIFLLFINYLSNLDYLYRLPFPIHQIIAYNSSGLCVYSRSVYTKGFKIIQVEEMLFSGLISAIASAVKDTLGTSTELRYIDATNKHILLQMNKGLTFVVIADNKSSLLMESIKTVNNLVSPTLRSKIEENIVNISEFSDEFDKLVKIGFPYILHS